MRENYNTVLLRYFKAHYPIAIGAVLFMLLPVLYGWKIEAGIVKWDLYLVWILGSYCWLKCKPGYASVSDYIFGFGICVAAISTALQSKGDANSFKTLITVFFSFGVYLYLRLNATLRKNIVWVLAPSVLYQLKLGWSQILLYKFDPLMIKGSFSNSGYYANFLAPCIVIMSGYLFSVGKQNAVYRNRVWIIRLLLLLAIPVLIATTARAAILGVLVAVVYLLRSVYIPKIKKTRRIYPGIIAITFVLGIVIFLFLIKKNSALGRLTIYKVTLDIIRDNLWFGVGANRFQIHYNLYQADFFGNNIQPIDVQLLAGNTFEAFNFVLQWLAEYGLISLIVGFCFFYQLFKQQKTLVQNKDATVNASVASLLCILVCGLFSNPFHCTVIFILCLALVSDIGSNYTGINRSKFQLKYERFSKSIVLFISVAFLYYGITQFRNELKWKEGFTYARYGNIERMSHLYSTAYPFLKNDGYFLFNYGSECVSFQNIDTAVQLLERAKQYHSFSNLYIYLGMSYFQQGKYDLAEKNYLTAACITPAALIPKYQLIKLYLAMHNTDKLKKWLVYTKSYPVKIKDEISDAILRELNQIHIN